MLVNLDTGELIDNGGGYQNDEYSCDSITYSYCLPEGNYELVLEDLFGNGMHYPCQPEWESGSVYTILGNDTLTSAVGNWGDDEILPFYVGPPPVECPPLGDCPWDIDGDGIVAVSDIIVILQNFGLFYDCSPMDFDQDGVIGVSDLLDAISVFGLSCSTGQLSPEGEFELFLKEENNGEVVNTTLYNIMGQEVKETDYLSTGIYVIVQEWMIPDVGTIITKKKIIKE